MANAGRTMPRRRALIVGLGFTGKAVARRLLADGWEVAGTGRSLPEAEGVRGVVFDGEASDELRGLVGSCDLLVASVPPGPDGGDPLLDAVPDMESLCGGVVAYLSATSVYGDRGGDWVFEGEVPGPETARGRRRAEAELRWLETGLPVHVLRLAGIYGPGRSPLDKVERAVVKPGHVVNRIHVDDIAELVARVADSPAPGIYNVADGHPAPPDEVVRYAAGLLGAPEPREVAWTDPSLSAMARSFYGETKRVDIEKAKNVFGWEPHHPNYREGLRAVLVAEQGEAERGAGGRG